METLIIELKDEQELELIRQLLKRMRIKSKVLGSDKKSKKLLKKIDAGLKDVKAIEAGQKKGKSISEL